MRVVFEIEVKIILIGMAIAILITTLFSLWA